MATNSPADDIATLLQTAAVGTRGTDLFVGTEPLLTTLTVTVFDTPGANANPKWLRDNPSVQVQVRGTAGDYATAWAKQQAVKDALLGKDPTTVGTTDYISFRLFGDIFSLGPDENNRPLLISNWLLIREMSSGGNREAL